MIVESHEECEIELVFVFLCEYVQSLVLKARVISMLEKTDSICWKKNRFILALQ